MIRILWRLILFLVIAGPVWAQSNTLDILAGLRDQPMNPVLLREIKASLPQEKDPNMQCRLGVLYTLGSFASGNAAEGLSMRAAIQKAFPGNDLLQDMADNRISDPCDDCRQGVILDPCSACNGTGRCQPCKGTGQQILPGLGDQTRKIKCMHCVDAPGKCKKCGGAKGFPKACPTCAGSGLLGSPAKANTLYLRLLHAMAPPKEGKEPVMLVVTAAPPEEVRPDPEVVKREWVERTLAAAKDQAAASPFLQKYAITGDDIRRVRDPGLAGEAREDVLKALRGKGLPHARGHYFALPFPAGVRYCVAEVKRNPYGGSFLKLTSTAPAKNPPADPLTPRDVLSETARGLCEPLGDFLSEPTVCVPDTASFRKGEIVESGPWIIPVKITQWGDIQKEGACYRTPDEMRTQLGIGP